MSIAGHERDVALHEAGNKARIISERELATLRYFDEILGPAVSVDGEREPAGVATFDPRTMSPYGAARELERIFDSVSGLRYYHREAAINARNPATEADEVERAFS